jgi:hypothetical protein
MNGEKNQHRIIEVRAAIAAVNDSLTGEEFGEAAQINTENGGGHRLVVAPAAFWNDHAYRDCDSDSVEVRSSATDWSNDDGSYVVLVMSDEFLMELVSDAAHYSNGWGEDYEPLMESARRTIVALWEQFPAMMKDDADLRTSRDNLRWSLGIERNDVAVITG